MSEARIREWERRVLEAIQLEEREMLVFLDREGKLLYEVGGDADSTAEFTVTPELAEMLIGAIAIHGHPGQVSFSEKDLEVASKLGLWETRVVRADGYTETITLGNSTVSERAVKDAVERGGKQSSRRSRAVSRGLGWQYSSRRTIGESRGQFRRLVDLVFETTTAGAVGGVPKPFKIDDEEEDKKVSARRRRRRKAARA